AACGEKGETDRGGNPGDLTTADEHRSEVTSALAAHRGSPPRGRRCRTVTLRRLMGLFDRVLRAGEGKRLRALKGLVPDINALEATYEPMSDEELRAQTGKFRERLDNG